MMSSNMTDVIAKYSDKETREAGSFSGVDFSVISKTVQRSVQGRSLTDASSIDAIEEVIVALYASSIGDSYMSNYDDDELAEVYDAANTLARDVGKSLAGLKNLLRQH